MSFAIERLDVLEPEKDMLPTVSMPELGTNTFEFPLSTVGLVINNPINIPF